MDLGICGWYYAYDKNTKFNSGFAPKFCVPELETNPFETADPDANLTI